MKIHEHDARHMTEMAAIYVNQRAIGPVYAFLISVSSFHGN